jgi:UDP-N-acetylmuramate-alanine ligase
VKYVGDIETAAAAILPDLLPGDLVITLGAGTVTRLSDDIVAALEQ